MASVRTQHDYAGPNTDKKVGDKSSPPEQHKPFIRTRSQSGTEHVHYSLIYEGFPEEFQDRAEKELKETPENRKKGLQRLKEYMKSQNMPPLKDDLCLLASLRCCKYNLKKAEAKLRKLMSVRQETIVRLRDLGMEAVECIVDDMPYGFFPYRDKCGRAIFYTRPEGLNLDRYTVGDVTLMATAGALFILSFPITSVSGFVYIGDCKCPSLYLLYSILKELRTGIFTVLSLPMRLARVESLHENAICRMFYSVIKQVLSKKIVNRVYLHGSDLEQFHAMYDPNVVPEEYGGNAGPLSNQVYKQKFLDFIRDLINEEC